MLAVGSGGYLYNGRDPEQSNDADGVWQQRWPPCIVHIFLASSGAPLIMIRSDIGVFCDMVRLYIGALLHRQCD